MEPFSSITSQQNSAAQSTSTRNLRNWFDEFKAKVSKKSQPTQTVAGEASSTVTHSEDDVQSAIRDSPRSGKARSRSRNPNRSSLRSTNISTIYEPGNEGIGARTESSRGRFKSVVSMILTPLGWIIYYLIPFNHNLPWKLLSLINSSFVIIVIGLASGSADSSEAFSFTNGFVCGLATAIISFIILTLSFIVYILPKSQDTSQVQQSSRRASLLARETVLGSSPLGNIETSLDCTELREEDFCLLEELDQTDANAILDGLSGDIDDEDYRGWMIEFIGDYELRNSSDIKLKSIYVKIESGILYLCKTKNSPDADSNSIPAFTSQRVFDLNQVNKFSAHLLIPKNVRNKQKYVWSKKYPIKLEFQVDESNDSAESPRSKLIQLTLLAKSCREKEEWFRKFNRVVANQRLGNGPHTSKSSFKSDPFLAEEGLSESILSSFKRFRCRSPSPKRDCVQTSQSSHFLGEQKKILEEEECDETKEPCQSSGLVRTKSCELLHRKRCQTSSSETSSEQDGPDKDCESREELDDSTLTRETADLFSQNIDNTNFLESRPTLDYKEFIERLIENGKDASSRSDWFNALTGRIFFDVFSHNYWSLWFKRKIQRKLYRIRLPYFMETLTLTQIDLGTNAPQFSNVESHSFDSLGLSIDFAMAYTGGLTMTFETKLNLLKIKSDPSTSNSANPSFTVSGSPAAQATPTQLDESNLPGSITTQDAISPENTKTKEASKTPLSSSTSTRTSCESTTSDSDDSDSDSSSGSSFDEAELNEISDWEDYGAEKTRQNILKFVDKIASSKYFQHATENRYIKKKLQDISNCPLVLVVKIQSLNGVLTLNVPPPQTDRIWYGFKPTPELELKAIPKMGDREVSLSHVTDWIERKLAEEFRKILVIPNMEDILLPVLRSDHMQYITTTR